MYKPIRCVFEGLVKKASIQRTEHVFGSSIPATWLHGLGHCRVPRSRRKAYGDHIHPTCPILHIIRDVIA